MTAKQRELVSKYLSDLSKGVLIAGMVGLGAGTLRWWVFLLDVFGASVAIGIAYWLEGRTEWNP